MLELNTKVIRQGVRKEIVPVIVKVEQCKCAKCGYEWFPEINRKSGKPTIPKRCANKKCNSPNWNRPEKIRN